MRPKKAKKLTKIFRPTNLKRGGLKKINLATLNDIQLEQNKAAYLFSLTIR